MDVTVAELHQANLKYLREPVSVEIETDFSVEIETDFSVEIETDFTVEIETDFRWRDRD